MTSATKKHMLAKAPLKSKGSVSYVIENGRAEISVRRGLFQDEIHSGTFGCRLALRQLAQSRN
jgi:hypothetical protein